MKLIHLTLGYIFLINFSESQLTQPLQGSVSSIVGNILPSNQPQPYCVQNSSSSDNTSPSCSLPFDNYSEGLNEPGSEIHPNNSVFPPWMNLAVAKRGQAFANNYLFANILSHGFGLIYTITNPLLFGDVLISTHKTDTGERATYRYFATMTQVLNWYQGDLTDMTNTAVSASLRNVRDRHFSVAQQATSTLNQGEPLVSTSYYDNVTLNTILWDAFYTDLETSEIPQEYRTLSPEIISVLNDSQVPISQAQEGFTQFAFVGLPVLLPERTGIGLDATDDDFLAFNHLWAVLGYGLGIKDQYNIALQPNLTATREYYQKMYNNYFLPVIFSSNQNATKVLGEAVLEAFEAYTTQYGLSKNTFLYLFLNQIIDIPAPNLYSLLSDEEKIIAAEIETQYLPLYASDPAYRVTVNTAFNDIVQVLGIKYFGDNYVSIQYRADDVYY